jgi:predicted ATPase/DNA-binding XRE family transcriptional regulator
MISTPNFGELLQAFRSEARLSQQALAQRAGLSARTISDIERGVARPTRPLTISLLEEALGLTPLNRERLRTAARSPAELGSRSPGDGPPSRPSRLVGRDAEIAAIRETIGAGARLLTVLGAAGIGKTALALSAARAVGAACDSVIVVELAALPSAELVPSKIALAVNAQRFHDGSAAESLGAALAGRRILFVLDNFEHVARAAPFVGEFLAAAPGVTIIATSRVPLRLSLEREFPIGPLTLPGLETTDVAVLEQFGSVQLFIERTRALVPDFALTRENAASVTQIALALEGFPLAIELAAPLLQRHSPAELAGRLTHRLPLLSSQRDDVPLRHRTMRDAIGWSYNLLPALEQRGFRRFGVFRGAFGVEAAHALLMQPGGEGDALTTMRALGLLVAGNLIRVVRDTEEPRFDFLPFVREYAEESLRDSGENDDAYSCLAEHCLAVARSVDFVDPSTQSPRALDRIAEESAHIDALLAWAQETGRTELSLRVGLAMYAYWWLRAAPTGTTWMGALVAGAERESIAVNDTLLADVYTRAASLADQSGMADAAERYSEKALTLRRRLDDEAGIATLLAGSGVRAMSRGDYENAKELLTQSLEIRRREGLPLRVAMVLCDLGVNAAQAGDAEASAQYLEESIAGFRSAGSDLGLGVAFATLGLLAVRAGMLERAEAYSRQSLVAAEPLGNAPTIALANYNLASVALNSGQLDLAEALAREAFDLYQSSGREVSTAWVMDLLAAVALAREDATRAARLIGAAGELRRRAHSDVAPAERAAYERLVAAVKARLEPGGYLRARDAGAADAAGGRASAVARAGRPG